MIAVFALTMVVLVVLVVGELVLDLPPTLERAIVSSLVTLTGLGLWMQFKKRCPNCGYRLGFQSCLLTPTTCKRCGVGLKARNRQ